MNRYSRLCNYGQVKVELWLVVFVDDSVDISKNALKNVVIVVFR